MANDDFLESSSSKEKLLYLFLLKAFTAYFVLSIITLPFLDSLWLGELPLVAVIQLPKIIPADYLRKEAAMPLIRMFFLPQGSFSPTYIMARPYGLALAYLIPLAFILIVLWWRTRISQPYRRWVYILLFVVIIDYCFTLAFSSKPGITIY